MKEFNVYQHPVRGWQAVKEGFSWPGFFFGWLWCFVKGLFGWGFAILALAMVVGFFVESESVLTGISFVLAMAIGSQGNEWRCDRLLRKGYSHIGKVTARTSYSAITEVSGGGQQSTVPPTENLKPSEAV